MTASVIATCDDVLIGGTISGSTISGGTSLANVGLSIRNYGALWGGAGWRSQATEVVGQPGVVLPGALIGDRRTGLLTVTARPYTSTGVASATGLDDNMSTVLGEFTNPAGAFIEWVRLDGTSVWQTVYALSPPTLQSLLERRVIQIAYTGVWPYWQSETLNTDTVNSAGVSLSPAIGGDVYEIANPTMVFAGDGTFTDDTTGLTVTVSGSASAVTIARDTLSGRWRVTQSGSDAPGLATWNDSRVMVLSKGGTFTSTVSVDVSWRDQWA